MNEEVIMLTEKHFQLHPVWMWNDSRDTLIPVERFDPLPSIGDALWIRTRFIVPDGNMLFGYIVDDGSGTEIFGLFVNGKECVFGKHVQDDVESNLEWIRTAFNQPDWQLFPIRYESDFHYEGQPNLSGVFEPWWV